MRSRARPSPASTSSSEGSSSAVGGATTTGTARFAERFATRFTEDFFRRLAPARTPERAAVRDTERGAERSAERGAALTIGSIGLGTYLGDCTDAEDARYEAALLAGFAAGCNLVDTAINYRCQRSERAVGRALARAIADGVVRRDEVVIGTKGGYVALDGAPPPTRADYDAYLEREFFAPGVMAREDLVHGGHSLAPGFLAHQIARSRANLGIETIDVYYLHEPERQLDVSGAHSTDDAFAAALRRAIEALEASVSRGEIARWGVATWRGLRVPPGSRGHLALTALVDAARDVAGEAHHFAAVQLPISLAMPEAVRLATQLLPMRSSDARPVPLLQAAQELGVPVIASAALMQARLTANLPVTLREAFPGCETDAQRAITFVRGLPGVCAALVGMRSMEHLAENLRAAR